MINQKQQLCLTFTFFFIIQLSPFAPFVFLFLCIDLIGSSVFSRVFFLESHTTLAVGYNGALWRQRLSGWWRDSILSLLHLFIPSTPASLASRPSVRLCLAHSLVKYWSLRGNQAVKRSEGKKGFYFSCFGFNPWTLLFVSAALSNPVLAEKLCQGKIGWGIYDWCVC